METRGGLEHKDCCVLMSSRNDAVQTVPMVMGTKPANRWQLEFDPDASADAKARRARWLGREI